MKKTLALLFFFIVSLFALSSCTNTEKGVVINTAFAVCGSFMLGDHLAYVASTDASISLPLILGKLIGGVFALIIAFIVTKAKKEKAAYIRREHLQLSKCSLVYSSGLFLITHRFLIWSFMSSNSHKSSDLW